MAGTYTEAYDCNSRFPFHRMFLIPVHPKMYSVLVHLSLKKVFVLSDPKAPYLLPIMVQILDLQVMQE